MALLIGVSGLLPQLISCGDEKRIQEALDKYPVNAWVKLSEDGSVVIYNPAAEMGQGSMTSLPLLFAEEMDADWEKVQVEFSPQVTEIYGSPGWGPGTRLMFTVGSRTTNSYYTLMRQAGAQARHILLHSAAVLWDVPLEELRTSPHEILHRQTDRQIGYGDLVPHLRVPDPLPEFTEDQLKDPKDFRLVGTYIPRWEIPAKVTGAAQFAMDLRLSDMVYGVLERGNLHGASPRLENEAEILDLEGVLKIIPFSYAIGVVATTLELALRAKKQLKIRWSDAKASDFNSQKAYREYELLAENGPSGVLISDKGDFDGAIRNANRTYRADFKNDYVYHAQMEPLNAVVQVAEDGSRAEVWVGSQQGPDSKLGVPSQLGIPPEKVDVHLQYLGGGFGRRSMKDFIYECTELAREMAPSPVKLVWTREDDIGYGAFRPMSLQRLRASVDRQGKITGLSHLVVGDGGNLLASGAQNDYYSIPNQRVEWRETSHGIRLKHWRSVGHGPNKFAIECILDEIAADLEKDPVALRRELMAESPRALATLEKAAEMAGWGGPLPDGHARGVAFVEHGSFGTGICEISVDRESGNIRVHRFWCALDAGVIVQPDNVKAQIEGGVLMGMSSVLKEQITISQGRVQQSNFHDYKILRMQDVPESVEVVLLPSSEHPEGVGETGTPLVACAIANAFFSLTGKRLRHLPFTPERVLEALNT